MIPLINHDSSEGEQWGRYNLPRLMVVIKSVLNGSVWEWCIRLSLQSAMVTGKKFCLTKLFRGVFPNCSAPIVTWIGISPRTNRKEQVSSGVWGIIESGCMRILPSIVGICSNVLPIHGDLWWYVGCVYVYMYIYIYIFTYIWLIATLKENLPGHQSWRQFRYFCSPFFGGLLCHLCAF